MLKKWVDMFECKVEIDRTMTLISTSATTCGDRVLALLSLSISSSSFFFFFLFVVL